MRGFPFLGGTKDSFLIALWLSKRASSRPIATKVGCRVDLQRVTDGWVFILDHFLGGSRSRRDLLNLSVLMCNLLIIGELKAI